MGAAKSLYDPQVDLYRRRNAAVLRRRANELVQEDRFREAALLYREGLSLTPRDGVLALKLAEAMRRSGALDEAIAVYRQAANLFAADGDEGKATAARHTVDELRRESRRLARQVDRRWWTRISRWLRA